MPLKPSENDFLVLIGPRAALWTGLRAFLASTYDGHTPGLSVGKKEHDWTIRYRRSRKTLVTLMPEQDGFCVLVVLGKDEVAKSKNLKLSATVQAVYDASKQFHDGRWLWIRPRNKGDLDSIKALLAAKRKPDRA